MAAGQSIVMEEHSPLQLKVLAPEGEMFDLALFLYSTGAVFFQRLDCVHEPKIARLKDIFVAVDLGLLKGPLRKGGCMGPHRDASGHMDQLEMA